jgi:hypothetical protein
MTGRTRSRLKTKPFGYEMAMLPRGLQIKWNVEEEGARLRLKYEPRAFFRGVPERFNIP